MSWLNRLMEPGIAEWVCKSAHGIILAVLDMCYERSEDVARVRVWLIDRNKFTT